MHPKKEGEMFGLVWKIILLGKRRTKNKLDHMGLIINYLNKRRVGGLERAYMGIHI